MLGALLAVIVAVPAMAADTTVSISGGALTVTAPEVNEFPTVILDGTAQTVHAPLEPFTVTDARGTGHGWTVSLQATPFREWDGTGYVTDGRALPPGSLLLEGLSVTADGTDSDGPTVVAGPYVLDGPAVTVATATAGSGMGTFTFDPTAALAVSVPAHAYARAYRSELSISVTSGP